MKKTCDFCLKKADFLYPSPNDDGSEDQLCESCFDPIALDLTEGKESESIIFDEDACAEMIFNKLIAQGIAVRIEDIRLIMNLEVEYGESIGLYGPPPEDGFQPTDTITVKGETGGVQLFVPESIGEDNAIEMLEEAIRIIKTFR
ncbi:hypothetical protein HQN89_10710 [Paenibacillus frigoriresistens]|uniref:hypothetical protein n=1 Tax=Paenibacillus alginolyticus TaxID=59839 RepID=UPI001565F2AD|nr:hypothetical protein [Paenibacillus frigoriresistens]NRF91490.1 hypothetical protein [Paenibacillus frigoriresistens]